MAVILELPKDLEKEAEAAGLLTPEAFAAMLRENLRRRHLRELQQDSRKMAADDIPPMTMEEIQEEVNAVRAERRAKMRAAAGWLPRALRELDGIDEEVEEEKLPPISEGIRAEARRLLVALGEQPVAPMVCPTEYGDISLYFKAPNARGAIHIVLDNNGEAAWYCVIPGKKGYGRHKNPADLPIDFLMGRLRALGSAPGDS